MMEKDNYIDLYKLEEKDTVRKNRKVVGIIRKVPSGQCQKVINLNSNNNNSNNNNSNSNNNMNNNNNKYIND
jgi:hypothetical protein